MNAGGLEVSNKRKNMTVALTVIAVIVAIASAFPAVQSRIRSLFIKPNRTILAKISGFYGGEQTEYLILKIKTEMGLQIEFYQNTNNTQNFKQKFDLIHDTDAFITIDRNTTNLALSDVNRDGTLEVLAPSVDRNGNLRLNSFKYNPDFKTFEPLGDN